MSDLGYTLDIEREFFDNMLRDSCTAYGESATEATWNEETGMSEYPTDTVIYQGPCSVFQAISDRRITEGGDPLILGEWVVRVPVTATGFTSGSVVTIDAVREKGDPSLVGLELVVRRVGVRSDAILRRLFCDIREQTSP